VYYNFNRVSTNISNRKVKKITQISQFQHIASRNTQNLEGIRTRLYKCIQTDIPDSSIEDLFKFLGLGSDVPSDFVFVSLDFENTGDIHRLEVGIAILDTQNMWGQDAIITENGTTKGKQSKPFLFGKTVEVPEGSMLGYIESCIPRNRKIILVAHAITNELKVLQDIGFDLATSVVGAFDTSTLPRPVNAKNRSTPSLKNTVQSLRCSFDGFRKS
jgi:hypothetical protein